MKRNVKKIFALVFAVAMFCASFSVSAAVKQPDSVNAMCKYCGKGQIGTKCWGDYTYYTSGKGTHFPWDACTVSFYQATAKEWCSTCFKVNKDLGKHNCYQIHSSCGQGKVWTCIQDISAGGDW